MTLQKKSKIPKSIGWLIFLLGTLGSIYLGVWVMFIGGIVQMINGIKANPTNATMIAIGLLRFICSGFVGFAVFAICMIIIDYLF